MTTYSGGDLRRKRHKSALPGCLRSTSANLIGRSMIAIVCGWRIPRPGIRRLAVSGRSVASAAAARRPADAVPAEWPVAREHVPADRAFHWCPFQSAL